MLRKLWTWMNGGAVTAWGAGEVLSGADAQEARRGFVEHFGGDERFVGLVALQRHLPEHQRAG